jgi:uncharacterized protein HemX
MNLDHELRQALKRKDPPAGFDRRVLTRIAAGDVVRSSGVGPSWHRVVLPVAAALVLTVAGTYFVHQREQRQAREQWIAAERATSEVAFALQIASEKLAAAQTKVREFNQHDHTIQP